jgi:hypothetical protein
MPAVLLGKTELRLQQAQQNCSRRPSMSGTCISPICSSACARQAQLLRRNHYCLLLRQLLLLLVQALVANSRSRRQRRLLLLLQPRAPLMLHFVRSRWNSSRASMPSSACACSTGFSPRVVALSMTCVLACTGPALVLLAGSCGDVLRRSSTHSSHGLRVRCTARALTRTSAPQQDNASRDPQLSCRACLRNVTSGLSSYVGTCAVRTTDCAQHE